MVTPATKTCIALIVSLLASLSNADLHQKPLEKSSLIIQVWNGDRGTPLYGVVAQSDRYNGYVVTSSIGIDRADNLTTITPGGAELTAQVIKTNQALGLALLKVNGLSMKAPTFTEFPLAGGDDVWSVTPDAFPVKSGVVFTPTSITNVRGDSRVESLQLSFQSNAEDLRDRPASLVNECGEFIGFKLPGQNVAVGAGPIVSFLNSANIRPEKASAACLTAVELARRTAEQAGEVALLAKQEAKQAQEIAQGLAARLAASDERNQTLIEEASRARKAASQAMATAELAQRYADETRSQLEKQNSALVAETEAMVEHLQQDRAAAEERFRETLEAERRQATERENLLLFGLVVLIVLVLGLMVVTQRFIGRNSGPSAILTGIGEEPKSSQPASPALKPAAPAPHEKGQEFLFEGRDEDGIRYLLRVSGSQLGNGGIVIGRESKHTINHVDVSRQHARMSLKQGQVLIEDLASTNGTSVNGETIDDKGPVAVTHGDQVIFGSVMMNLRVLGA